MVQRVGRVEFGVTWVLRNLDGLIAVGLGLTIGLMHVFGDVISDKVASGATLLVLGTLAVGSMTERLRRKSDIREASADTRRALEDLAMVRSLSGDEVGDALEQARAQTNRWYFKGGTGTYLRAVTLPRCVEAAIRQRAQLSIKIDIINPADEQTCAAYARFRQTFVRRRNDDAAHAWTADRTRKEAYATVLAACWFRQRLDTLEISVHLSSGVPTLRFDLSETCLIITQDDPNRVNLLVTRDQPLYDYYVTELHQSREQAVRLDLRGVASLGDEPTVDEVRAVFDDVDLPLPSVFSDADVAEIVEKALHAEDPYRR
ncbi:hypothetical protein GCM10010211_77940 [Streptomyces albospinus]|uniref:Uncharacterized protein n=1 Tax=Streptomyces albospinus TaxID=285515 RepID=A0ABQ2VMP5_9ACTN|nr:hypothetical protein [Streptomyces albospinus]GGU98977.1 hypothetical protein GCM10010211_77940 [Streptomyces albospinus]